MNGLLLSFEGCEGCGKSTQLNLLAARLRALAGEERVITLREPGATRIGEEIRGLLKCSGRGRGMRPETELLLFAASRAQLVREVIEPGLAKGAIILCDRFVDSTTVYQAIGRGLDPELVARINTFAAGGRLPDATLLFDLPVAAARKRLRERAASFHPSLAADRLDQESDAFFEAVRDGYRRLAESAPSRFIILDALPPSEAVADAVWAKINERFHGFFAPHRP